LTSQTCTRKTCRSQTQKVTESGTDTQWPFEHCLNGPRIHEFLEEIRRDVLSKYGDDVLMVGECPMTEPDEILRYVSAREKELNMVFDFSMMYVGMGIEDGAMETKAWDLPELKTAVAKAQLLNPAWTSVFAVNHDAPRSPSRFTTTDAKFRVKAGKLLAIMLATLTGTLFTYQGQEIGMENVPKSWTIDDFRDVGSLIAWKEASSKYAGDKEKLNQALQMLCTISGDNARTPVKWDDGFECWILPRRV
jgi:oligo-1,6-glucosidase